MRWFYHPMSLFREHDRLPHMGKGRGNLCAPPSRTQSRSGIIGKVDTINTFIRRRSSLADVSFDRALRSETRAPLEGVEGFGCHLIFNNPYQCHEHCKSVGYRGGYCKNKIVCTCY